MLCILDLIKNLTFSKQEINKNTGQWTRNLLEPKKGASSLVQDELNTKLVLMTGHKCVLCVWGISHCLHIKHNLHQLLMSNNLLPMVTDGQFQGNSLTLSKCISLLPHDKSIFPPLALTQCHLLSKLYFV